MDKYYELLIENLFDIVKSEIIDNTIEQDIELNEKEQVCEYRNILDKIVIKTIYHSFEELVFIEALLKLARTERIIIVFNYIYEINIIEIANILDCNVRSLYVQRGTALRKLRKLLLKFSS